MYKQIGAFLFILLSIQINCQSETAGLITGLTTGLDTTTDQKTTKQETNPTTKNVQTTGSFLLNTTTTSSITDECSTTENITCSECLKNEKCFFCNTDNKCRTLVMNGIFPANCTASSARWISCSLDFQALLIAVICIGVVVLLIVVCCVCYCCNKTCKAISDKQMRKVERKISRQREAMKQRNEVKKQDRQSRNDAIRVKYGLRPSTYSPMD